MPPSASESAATMISSHSPSTRSATSPLTRSMRAISNEIDSTSAGESICVSLAADSAPSTMQRMAALRGPVSPTE